MNNLYKVYLSIVCELQLLIDTLRKINISRVSAHMIQSKEVTVQKKLIKEEKIVDSKRKVDQSRRFLDI